MIGYKGFDKDMKCRGFQYRVGAEYKEEEAKICESGFHFCEFPLDVFSYYAPADSRFATVEPLSKAHGNTDDSKKCTKTIKIKSEIGLTGIIKAGVEYIVERVDWKNVAATNTGDWSAATNTGNRSAATNTGDWSAATNTGDWSAATNTGNRSAATNTGNWSAATNTGDWSAASVSGKEGVAISIGREGRASGSAGSWIVLAEWEQSGGNDGEWHRMNVACFYVDGEKIKEGTYYKLKNGKAVEAE